MVDNLTRRKALFLGILFSLVFFVSPALASETNGTVDGTYKYAWGENIGWINFGCSGCDVEITDDAVTGNAWSSQFGWINLNPTTSGVENDGTGILSGFAWSPNLGWIDFTGVTINTNGEFLGYATLKSDSSQINFNCATGDSCAEADFRVKTDWRRESMRNSGGSSGSAPRNPPPPPVTPPVIPPFVIPPTPITIVDNISDVINYASDFISYLFGGDKPATDTLAEVPKIAPKSFGLLWNLLPVKAINSFVFAPLPYDIRILANKFPELDKTLKSVGVERLSDLGKLTGVSLNIPGLANILNKTITTVGLENLSEIDKLSGVSINIPGLSNLDGQMMNNVGVGKIALIKGLPIAKFSPSAKKNLPAEFVFARANQELVDLNVALSVGERGEVSQQMSTLPGQTLRLVVKPISKASSVTGYFVFKASTPKVSTNSILRSSLTASALFSMNDFVEQAPSPFQGKAGDEVENKLVLSTFEYTDPDNDGIYTADVVSPVVPGEYEIITVINYIDPVLGTRQMRMTTVIDPEGYVFEKNNGKETRIPSAIVSLYHLNTGTKKYELWPAKDYQQENPQVTDVRGTYSFLVPEGSYYFEVEAPGYLTYRGKAFLVAEGNGIHQNIELASSTKWIEKIDFQTVLLIVVLLLLMYNYVRGRARDKVVSP
ncbi:hypothetical protein A2356_00070 [Candidatus Nomurabacteria bacterium RIFOXYB1_FULL_39_16]|uniref:Carboxypeptidase regulatory-like domain-containing protein n=2 Tax=Candidatus Nomuraibacteriota TaxID=1752729 RepID=A0A0G0QS54_9BACT|nr:MAG: hypothetical protein UT78_C0010G0011 [Candidatus Nomurabacteria bacterium GW2011_GWF2_40_12]OGJ08810.1 MAG: hypothetical protein A2356_00070 [Candidatus Nomurabacteria bacterium RIFOXYB1_FULL_39_16]OGJ13993.1 MAG: hypothetical protein A2585_00815 [Candidatus Nomurabacteria bacterium RIFOXYD1_FULL_39_12]